MHGLRVFTTLLLSLFFLSFPAWGQESIYTEEGHTEITLAIRSGEYAEAVRLIAGATDSNWLVSRKVFKEVAEPCKQVAVLGAEAVEAKCAWQYDENHWPADRQGAVVVYADELK